MLLNNLKQYAALFLLMKQFILPFVAVVELKPSAQGLRVDSGTNDDLITCLQVL